MTSATLQLVVLAVIALVLILRLRSVLGTRQGFEGKPEDMAMENPRADRAPFEVVEGGLDRDIYDNVEKDSDAGSALAAMKQVEPEFSVNEFLQGARQAYEMILMAFEHGDRETLKQFLASDVFESFDAVISEREAKKLSIEAKFIGLREMRIHNATFDEDAAEAEIAIYYVGELTSVVSNENGEIIEGDANMAKKQIDIWTFARTMGSEDPNWQLVATGE